MKKSFYSFLFCLIILMGFSHLSPAEKAIRILVITGGHDYQTEQFNQMLSSLGENISYEIASFPEAFDMFSPENRDKYDVLVFYHMWQKITRDQQQSMADCIASGKPLLVLHHSICAFDDWPEYVSIIGGKYFHKPTTINGITYPACSYQHDLAFTVKVEDSNHPVTAGINDFEVFDETYKGYYVDPTTTALLTTNETSSTPIIGWTKKYGKSQVVILQSGHDAHTFENPIYRQLLKQSIAWVLEASN